MLTKELLKQVRQIEIKTRGVVNEVFSGEYHSVFKGRGMEFSEVREYQFGDDIRSIDWNVTARLNSPFVKIFEEERELTVMLMVDMSGSLLFGSVDKTKQQILNVMRLPFAKHVAIMPDCLTDDAEVLTDTGFKPILDINDNAIVCNYDPTTEKVFFDKVVGFVGFVLVNLLILNSNDKQK